MAELRRWTKRKLCGPLTVSAAVTPFRQFQTEDEETAKALIYQTRLKTDQGLVIIIALLQLESPGARCECGRIRVTLCSDT